MKVNNRFLVLEGLTGSGKTEQAQRLVKHLEKKHVAVAFNSEPTEENVMPFGKIIRAIIEGRPLDKELVRICINAISDVSASITVPVGTPLSVRSESTHIQKIFLDIQEKLHVMAHGENGVNLLSELELQIVYLVDRRFDLLHTIIPKTDKGILVVQDRYEMSTFAFGGSRGLNIENLWGFQLLIAGNAYHVPKATVLLEIKPEVAVERLLASRKTIDRFEESIESLRNIVESYDYVTHTFLCGHHRKIADSVHAPRYDVIVTINANQSKDEVFEELWQLVEKVF